MKNNILFLDGKVFYLGLIQSLFEGAMYTFVLEWTPALTPPESDLDHNNTNSAIPHGYIFASFMVSRNVLGGGGALGRKYDFKVYYINS